MDQPNVMQILSYVWPIIVIQLGIQIYALIDILRKKKTKNLSVPVWIVIVLLGNMLGAIAYLIVGKSDDLSD